MAHSDVLIFLVSVTWTALIFVFSYLLLVLLVLPSLYKKIRARQLFELSSYHDFLEAIRSSISGTFGLFNDCVGPLVATQLSFLPRRCTRVSALLLASPGREQTRFRFCLPAKLVARFSNRV